jgi:hypothetical protein
MHSLNLVSDYKNYGGRVVTGSDAGFIFKLFGFACERELELLQEAGTLVVQNSMYRGKMEPS